MTRHYSTKDFFRQMPNALLACYFQARGLFVDLDFLAMKETNPHELFNAWLALPDLQRGNKKMLAPASRSELSVCRDSAVLLGNIR